LVVARLLVVDDDAQQLELRKLLLEAAGYEVAVATAVDDAKRLLDQLRPDVLLMDLRLPKLKDGLRLIHAAEHRSPLVKVIVLSGWIEDLCDKPEEKLVSRVLGKPVRNDFLIEAIELARSS
jgi:two-component system response regulator GlrR